MKSINKVQLLGNIGNISDMSTVGNGIAVINFTVATNEKWKDKENVEHENVEWHNCSAFGNTASYINKHIHIGDLVLLEGKLTTKKVEGSSEGDKPRYFTSVRVKEFRFMRRKAEQTGDETPPPYEGGDSSDDIPF